MKLQRDIDRFGSLLGSEMGNEILTRQMQHDALTNKRSSKIQANYTPEGTILENVESMKYLGVTITNDLKWNTHISNVCTKANRTLEEKYLLVPQKQLIKDWCGRSWSMEAQFGTLTQSHSWPPGRTGKGPKSYGKVCDCKL